MTISNTTDLYAVVRSLIADLAAAGETAWAGALSDALSISSVAGEILGETRMCLRRLRKTPVAEQLRLVPRIDDVLAALDAWLGPWP